MFACVLVCMDPSNGIANGNAVRATCAFTFCYRKRHRDIIAHRSVRVCHQTNQTYTPKERKVALSLTSFGRLVGAPE